MRIPLDYYRILGLPIQATAEQLQQAHRDRVLQFPPRREFSEAAIAARRSLLDEAYAVLSDPTRRQEYDTGFLAKSYELLDAGRSQEAIDDPDKNGSYHPGDPDLGIDFYTPSIEIDESQFVGVLLILLELGEYELILKLGRPYLIGGTQSLKQNYGDPNLVADDIVLAVAVACLELGREQWNQGQYENAAESLETGRELLLREGVFAQLRGEMQAELYKLRPYRILELLALPESHLAERRQGLTLLQEMLQDRSGIDGDGADQSGLNTDDFLRFIQQLRSYLTSEEQQNLFEIEARRPSPVATYLAVYALVARGFAERQPALVRRAKTLLLRLSSPQQDVYLEQAVCALLLGQTEEASRALERSQEYESLAFIRDHSQGSPDLLPGLCLYSERWLQNEVFPHFRDLARKQASLKAYFADEDVQAYLEELPNEPETNQPWMTPGTGIYREPQNTSSQPQWLRPPRDTSTATLPDRESGAGLLPAERVPVREESHNTLRPNSGRNRLPEARQPGSNSDYGSGNGIYRPAPGTSEEPIVVSPSPRRSSSQKGFRLDRLLFLVAIGVISVGALIFLISRLFARPSDPVQSDNPAAIAPSAPASPSPTVSPSPESATEPLTETSASQVIQSWLRAKSAAMGEQHETNVLSNILTNPLLAEWRTRSEKARTEGWYWEYEHPNVEIVSVSTEAGNSSANAAGSNSASPESSPEASSPTAGSSTSSPDSSPTSSPTNSPASGSSTLTASDRAEVEAIVTERGELFVNGQLDQSSSYDDSIRARYSLVREQGQWKIEGIDVLQ
ncbi:IMS domain-containing protein [Leptolyngbya ohadii]|uniref:IMS domain-containing protein n=1 Tax=Leptolyngbya ohadii TaxID=1962290 RepID=UPI000B599E73|nr:IMS domain-containing protein [Leptolyngbya ohadii]